MNSVYIFMLLHYYFLYTSLFQKNMNILLKHAHQDVIHMMIMELVEVSIQHL